MSAMRIEPYIASRMVTRRKKRFVLLTLGILIVLMMVSAVSVVEDNMEQQNVYKARLNYGSWQLAFHDGGGAVKSIMKTGLAESACTAYRLQSQPIDRDTFSLDLILTDRAGYNIFTDQLTSGRLPAGAHEIMVENWYLDKIKAKKLPVDIKVGGIAYHIVGAFRSTVDDIAGGGVRAFGALGANRNLLTPAGLASAPDDGTYFHSDDAANDKMAVKPFVMIRLKTGVDLKKAVRVFSGCAGVRLFSGYDELGATPQKNRTPFYNVNLLAEQGTAFNKMSTNASFGQDALIADGMLLAVLFIMAFISMNIAAKSSTKELGLMTAVGLEPKSVRLIVILESLFVAVAAIPVGVVIGAGGGLLMIRHFSGSLDIPTVMPYGKILLDVVLCAAAIAAASIYPAVKAGSGSPLDTICPQPKSEFVTNFTGRPKLKGGGGQTGFALIFGVKRANKSLDRVLLTFAAVALLICVFITQTKEIEVNWKVGNDRASYKPDYTITVPYINYNDSGKTSTGGPFYDASVKPADSQFIEKIRELPGIRTVYTQSGYVNASLLSSGVKSKGPLYSYFIELKDDQMTAIGKKRMTDNGVTKKAGDPGINLISFGINGYGDRELAFARKYLVDGKIDTAAMRKDPVILLPKYVMSIGNMNIPSTKFKIGDKITVAEGTGSDTGSFKQTGAYTFIIGGFLNTLPFEAMGWSGDGLSAIVSNTQFEKLRTRYKATMEIYADAKKGADPSHSLTLLCKSRGYQLKVKSADFSAAEEEAFDNHYQTAMYAIFGVLGAVFFLAIFNIFLSDTLARKSEFALLAAVGMTRRQIYGSVLCESLIACIPGCIAGIALGMIFISKRGVSVGDELLPQWMLIPWMHIGAGAALVLLACIIAPAVSLAVSLKSVSVSDITQE